MCGGDEKNREKPADMVPFIVFAIKHLKELYGEKVSHSEFK